MSGIVRIRQHVDLLHVLGQARHFTEEQHEELAAWLERDWWDLSYEDRLNVEILAAGPTTRKVVDLPSTGRLPARYQLRDERDPFDELHDRVVILLETVEWSDIYRPAVGRGSDSCPVCHGIRMHGHREDCELVQILRALYAEQSEVVR